MVMLTMVLSVSLYSYGKARTRQAAFVRRRNCEQTQSAVLATGNNNTVIYTIPTTHQLARQYPTISQSTTTNINLPNQHNDLPPSYDQVVIISRDERSTDNQQNLSSPITR
ncbi:unnamed protein product [Diamesa hyperborea]